MYSHPNRYDDHAVYFMHVRVLPPGKYMLIFQHSAQNIDRCRRLNVALSRRKFKLCPNQIYENKILNVYCQGTFFVLRARGFFRLPSSSNPGILCKTRHVNENALYALTSYRNCCRFILTAVSFSQTNQKGYKT